MCNAVLVTQRVSANNVSTTERVIPGLVIALDAFLAALNCLAWAARIGVELRLFLIGTATGAALEQG